MNTKNYTVAELANMIDHTNLKPFANYDDIRKLCDEAKQYGFKMVAINSVQTKLCADYLKDSEVHVGAAISFPLGQTTIESKVFETKQAIENGADEIDYVINISELKEGHYDYMKQEMQSIVEVCKDNHVCSKVILENCYLTKDEIIKMCEIACEVKPDFVKTSTGFGTYSARVEDVALMKSVVKDQVKVKAAGGIRTIEDCLAMIEAGAERIGTSAGVGLVKAYEEMIQ